MRASASGTATPEGGVAATETARTGGEAQLLTGEDFLKVGEGPDDE